MPSKHSIAECLLDCGIASPAQFDDCDSIAGEFAVLKKQYFAKILLEHPDKGGDAEQFRKTRAAFEVLRELYQKGRVKGSFGEYLKSKKKAVTADDYNSIFENFGSTEVPSYQHFADAAEEEVPGYFVELARSGRSQCVKCKKGKKPKKQPAGEAPTAETTTSTTTTALSANVAKAPQYIVKNTVRVGSLDDRSGSYGRWHHLSCWRVPYRVWSGLTQPTDDKAVVRDLIRMDEVLLTGVTNLSEEDREAFVAHVMDRSNWARHVKRAAKKRPSAASAKHKADEEAAEPSADGNKKRSKAEQDDRKPAVATSSALTETQQRFVIPRPGMDGALTEDHLKGKRFVLTGIFLEVGGGTGLSLGKERVKRMIESFGGRVTSAVSGKTNYLIVGKEPGASKISADEDKGVPRMDMRTVQKLLYGENSFEAVDAAPPPRIESFSAGYSGYMIGH